jgi:hypothetical protein
MLDGGCCIMPCLQAACQSPAVYELLPPLEFPFAQPPPQLALWLRAPIPEDPDPGTATSDLQPILHNVYKVHEPPPQLAGAAAGPQPGQLASSHPAAPSLPRLSLARQQPNCQQSSSLHGSSQHGSGSNGGVGSSCSGILCRWLHHYIFHHDALPHLLSRLLKDNTGGLHP